MTGFRNIGQHLCMHPKIISTYCNTSQLLYNRGDKLEPSIWVPTWPRTTTKQITINKQPLSHMDPTTPLYSQASQPSNINQVLLTKDLVRNFFILEMRITRRVPVETFRTLEVTLVYFWSYVDIMNAKLQTWLQSVQFLMFRSSTWPVTPGKVIPYEQFRSIFSL